MHIGTSHFQRRRGNDSGIKPSLLSVWEHWDFICQAFVAKMPLEDLRIIADQERIRRYERDQVYCNGQRCRFHYITPKRPAIRGSVIFAVKYNDLTKPSTRFEIRWGAHQISTLNGTTSETIIGEIRWTGCVLWVQHGRGEG